jgi:peptidoglycan hydrolase CwlO-like protein
MKKKAIGIAAVIVMMAAGFLAYTVFRATAAAADAVAAYNAAVQEYNAAISPYNEAASGISEANNKLQGVLDAAQSVLDKGQAAYEPDTLDQLEGEIGKAKKSIADVPVQIDPLEEREVPGSFNTKELELAQHEAETALKAVEEAKAKILRY